jgi:hypothetical protein
VSLKVGLCDGKSWQDLCGTKDILASITNGFTIHIEMDKAVRSHDRALVDFPDAGICGLFNQSSEMISKA